MRNRNSIINIMVSMLVYLLISMTTMITPRALEYFLGKPISSMESLFFNATSLLGIIELGLGVGLVYKLYKPIQDKDYVKIAVILNFYKSAYKVIIGVAICIGTVIAFIVPRFIDQHTFTALNKPYWWVSVVFMFYVLDVVASYLFAHKRAMIIADQKNFLLNISHGIGVFVSCIVQVITLFVFKSFAAYAISKICCTVLENLFVAFFYNKRYSYIDLNVKNKLSKQERDDLLNNLKALLLHKIAGVSVSSIPGFIISKISTEFNRNYSIYSRVTSGLNRILNQIFDSVVASFGNLLVTETQEVVYQRFKSLFLINHFIQSFFCTAFFVCVTPFMILYGNGNGWLIGNTSLNLLTIYFYVVGMRQSLMMVKTSAGIYRPDRYFAVLEAVLNIVLSLILKEIMGVNGVLLVNTIVTFLVAMSVQPYLVYKNVFNQKIKYYYKVFALYAVLTLCFVNITWMVCNAIEISNLYVTIVVRALISMVIPNVLNIVVFWNTRSFKYIRLVVYGLMKKIFKREGKKYEF